MCFTFGRSPSVYVKSNVVARKPHKCSECRLPIHPGEEYERVWGVWDESMEVFKTCAFCCWLRARVTEYEYSVGCVGAEATPPHSGLYEFALDETPVQQWGYGLMRLEEV